MTWLRIVAHDVSSVLRRLVGRPEREGLQPAFDRRFPRGSTTHAKH